MAPIALYKVVHLIGVAFVVGALGGMAVHAANGGTREASLTRRMTTAAHGIGLLLVLGAGILMLGHLQQKGPMGWVVAKLVVWLLLGGAAAVPYRRPQFARTLFVIVPLLVGVAAFLALTKPF
jgi:hypothetical protein